MFVGFGGAGKAARRRRQSAGIGSEPKQVARSARLATGPFSRAAFYNPSAARSSALADSNSDLKSGWVEIVCAITMPVMRPISMSEA
jgi:hypothetical protein